MSLFQFDDDPVALREFNHGLNDVIVPVRRRGAFLLAVVLVIVTIFGPVVVSIVSPPNSFVLITTLPSVGLLRFDPVGHPRARIPAYG